MKKQRRFLCLSGGGYNNGWQISADRLFGTEWKHPGGVPGKQNKWFIKLKKRIFDNIYFSWGKLTPQSQEYSLLKPWRVRMFTKSHFSVIFRIIILRFVFKFLKLFYSFSVQLEANGIRANSTFLRKRKEDQSKDEIDDGLIDF